MSENFINYDALTSNDKTAPKPLLKLFTRAGETIAASWVDGKAKRDSGYSYKQIGLVFADNQEVILSIKQPGDIYQVTLNKKKLPIKEQDDIKKAIAEIIKLVKANSSKFQQLLVRRKVKLPNGIKSTVKRKEEHLQDEINQVDEAIVEAKRQYAILGGV